VSSGKYEIIKDIGYGCPGDDHGAAPGRKTEEQIRDQSGDCSKKDEVITNLFRLKRRIYF